MSDWYLCDFFIAKYDHFEVKVLALNWGEMNYTADVLPLHVHFATFSSSCPNYITALGSPRIIG